MELTLQSGQAYDHIRSGQMTPAMAAEYLRDGRVRVRNFGETLGQLYPGPDLQARLTAAFQGERDGLSAESAGRRVRSWLSGQNQPVNREDIFRIAFALGLGEGDASFLLGLCTDYGIHYREGRDVVYAWFFAHRAQLRRGPGLFRHPPPCAALGPGPGGGGVPPHPGAAKPVPARPDPRGAAGLLSGQPGPVWRAAHAGVLLFPEVPGPAGAPAPAWGGPGSRTTPWRPSCSSTSPFTSPLGAAGVAGGIIVVAVGAGCHRGFDLHVPFLLWGGKPMSLS